MLVKLNQAVNFLANVHNYQIKVPELDKSIFMNEQKEYRDLKMG